MKGAVIARCFANVNGARTAVIIIRWPINGQGVSLNVGCFADAKQKIKRKKANKSKRQILNPGDKVKMVDCVEAEHNGDEVWTVISNPWIVCGSEVVLLDHYPGCFDTKCLKKIEAEPSKDPAQIKNSLNQ